MERQSAGNVRWLRPREISDRLGVSLACLSKWRTEGKGPAFVKLGGERGAIRYSEADLEAFLDARRRASAPRAA
ncbi:helix-turn-helix domain-containing protein [Methylobacterium planeticum]|uniref:Helix-turn-helix domain-containing protein n=1 Tax=Methylobacterium planeticum TaxID=2615211 RepID=A0A6N6MHB8_9HYPH|nr:helix-turn-helix domain-containing protein [Methylobacterium planeticum]